MPMHCTSRSLSTLALLLLVGLAVTALHPTSARAATIQVTTTADQNGAGPECSLREAIQAATTNITFGGCPAGSAGPNTITFAVAGAITLDPNLGPLGVASGPLTIQGPGVGSLIIDGGGAVQLIEVRTGVQLTLTGLTLTRGASLPAGQGGFGGAILNGGTLTITSSTLSNNQGGFGGGAIRNDGGTVTITGSTLSGNQANNGGAVFSQFGGTLTITSSSLNGNQAVIGGVIYNRGGTVAITTSTLSGNQASFRGGAIQNGGPLRITTSTLSGNQAGFRGGAIENDGPLTLTSSTLSGNQARSDGGAITNSTEMTITNSTLSGNIATGAGGGSAIYAINDGSRVTITSSTIADNQGGSGPVLGIYAGSAGLHNVVLANPAPACGGGGAIADQGGNLAGDASCPFTSPSSRTTTDPRLGPLQDNGGPTHTMAPLPGSPVIDAAVACPPPETDQRGEPRTAPCDSGAVETEAASALTLSPTSGPEAGGTLVTITGQGFVPGQTSVSFGLSPATGVDCPSTALCRAFSPPGTGTVTVVVTVAGLAGTALVAGSFIYLPAPPLQPMTLVGQVWRQIPPLVSENQIEGTVIPVVGGVVEALVDDTVCGQGMTDSQGRVQLTVAADPPVQGCGRPGVVVSFRVNGEQAASEPLSFQSGGNENVTLLLPGPMPPPRR